MWSIVGRIDFHPYIHSFNNVNNGELFRWPLHSRRRADAVWTCRRRRVCPRLQVSALRDAGLRHSALQLSLKHVAASSSPSSADSYSNEFAHSSSRSCRSCRSHLRNCFLLSLHRFWCCFLWSKYKLFQTFIQKFAIKMLKNAVVLHKIYPGRFWT